MSNNIDDLLDLGAMSSSPPSQAATGGTPPSADPFDPFATTTLEPSTETGKGTFTAFDPFATIEATSPEGPPQDPFGADPFYPSKTTTQNDTQQDLFGGGDFTADLLGGAAEPDKDLIGQDQSHTEVVMSAAVSQQDQKAYEAQFDDLLGGFSNSSSGNPLYELVNGDEAVSQNSLDAYDDEGGSRAPAENGEVVTVTEEHITEDGATTTVVTETHTTVTDDGVEYKTVTTTRESYGEQDEDNLDESFDQSDVNQTETAPVTSPHSVSEEDVSIPEITTSQTSSSPSSPPPSDRQSAVESAFDDLLADFDETTAPRAEMEDSMVDLSPLNPAFSQSDTDVSENSSLMQQTDEAQEEAPQEAVDPVEGIPMVDADDAATLHERPAESPTQGDEAEDAETPKQEEKYLTAEQVCIIQDIQSLPEDEPISTQVTYVHQEAEHIQDEHDQVQAEEIRGDPMDVSEEEPHEPWEDSLEETVTHVPKETNQSEGHIQAVESHTEVTKQESQEPWEDSLEEPLVAGHIAEAQLHMVPKQEHQEPWEDSLEDTDTHFSECVSHELEEYHTLEEDSGHMAEEETNSLQDCVHLPEEQQSHDAGLSTEEIQVSSELEVSKEEETQESVEGFSEVPMVATQIESPRPSDEEAGQEAEESVEGSVVEMEVDVPASKMHLSETVVEEHFERPVIRMESEVIEEQEKSDADHISAQTLVEESQQVAPEQEIEPEVLEEVVEEQLSPSHVERKYDIHDLPQEEPSRKEAEEILSVETQVKFSEPDMDVREKVKEPEVGMSVTAAESGSISTSKEEKEAPAGRDLQKSQTVWKPSTTSHKDENTHMVTVSKSQRTEEITSKKDIAGEAQPRKLGEQKKEAHVSVAQQDVVLNLEREKGRPETKNRRSWEKEQVEKIKCWEREQEELKQRKVAEVQGKKQEPWKGKKATRESSDGTVSPAPSDRSADAGLTKEEKKALDYMKERYESTKQDMPKVVLRKPKQLQHQWNKQEEEEKNEEPAKDFKPLPKEQDLVAYTSVGLDYQKSKYVSKVEEEKEKAVASQQPVPKPEPKWDVTGPGGRPLPPPVNRCEPEKVAPPEITKSLRSMFESGTFVDLHDVKKTDPHTEPLPESGVYENEPQELEGVIRESDIIEMAGERLQKGHTKNLLAKWGSKGTEDKIGSKKKGPIKVKDEDEKDIVLENQPVVRKDVIRETDGEQAEDRPQKGSAKNLKNKFAKMKDTDEPKEKKEIKLVENEEPRTVYENEPEVREGVVRSDEVKEHMEFERGKIKNLAGFWATRSDDVKIEKKPILIERDAQPTVLENEPEVLEGVVKSDPQEEAVSIEEGRTKNMASFWKKRQDEEEAIKRTKQPFKLDIERGGPTVLENEPVVLENVVKHGVQEEETVPGEAGRTKNIASRFLKQEEKETGPKGMIHIERSGGPVVIENQPAELTGDVVRSTNTKEDSEVVWETGRTRNLLDHWVSKEEDAATPKTSTTAVQGKPRWVLEIEAAKEHCVYENEPEPQREDVVRGHSEERQDLIPDQHAKKLREVWMKKEDELEEEERRRMAATPELVRFTPPRQMTPPPGAEIAPQEEYERVTLSQAYPGEDGAPEQPQQRKKKTQKGSASLKQQTQTVAVKQNVAQQPQKVGTAKQQAGPPQQQKAGHPQQPMATQPQQHPQQRGHPPPRSAPAPQQPAYIGGRMPLKSTPGKLVVLRK